MSQTVEIESIETEPIQDIATQLRDAIYKVYMQRGNSKARKLFLQATEGLQVSHCVTKVGWVSGKYISFDCILYKGNHTTDIWDEIAKGVKKKIEMLSFIYGLNPTVFHFDPLMFANKPDKLYIGFKLKRDGEKKANVDNCTIADVLKRPARRLIAFR